MKERLQSLKVKLQLEGKVSTSSSSPSPDPVTGSSNAAPATRNVTSEPYDDKPSTRNSIPTSSAPSHLEYKSKVPKPDINNIVPTRFTENCTPPKPESGDVANLASPAVLRPNSVDRLSEKRVSGILKKERTFECRKAMASRAGSLEQQGNTTTPGPSPSLTPGPSPSLTPGPSPSLTPGSSPSLIPFPAFDARTIDGVSGTKSGSGRDLGDVANTPEGSSFVAGTHEVKGHNGRLVMSCNEALGQGTAAVEKTIHVKKRVENPTTRKRESDKLIADKKVTEKLMTDKKLDENITNDKKVPEKRTTDKKVPEKLITDKKVPEKLTTGKKVPEKLITDKTIPEKLTTDKKVPEKLTTDKKVPEKLITDKNVPEKLTTGKKVPEKLITDKTIPEKLTTDKKVPEKLTTDKKVPEKLITDKKVPEKLITDKKVPEKLITDKKVPEKLITDKKVPEKLITDKKVPEKLITDKKVPEKLTADKKVPEKLTTDKKVPEKLTIDKKVPEKRTTDKKVPEKLTTDKKVNSKTQVNKIVSNKTVVSDECISGDKSQAKREDSSKTATAPVRSKVNKTLSMMGSTLSKIKSRAFGRTTQLPASSCQDNRGTTLKRDAGEKVEENTAVKDQIKGKVGMKATEKEGRRTSGAVDVVLVLY